MIQTAKPAFDVPTVSDIIEKAAYASPAIAVVFSEMVHSPSFEAIPPVEQHEFLSHIALQLGEWNINDPSGLRKQQNAFFEILDHHLSVGVTPGDATTYFSIIGQRFPEKLFDYFGRLVPAIERCSREDKFGGEWVIANFVATALPFAPQTPEEFAGRYPQYAKLFRDALPPSPPAPSI